jgi:hypothetical protein|tara:strand:+ start:659 stop:877 length:219 start_codon:yes stop_codon:yes gene_type:complete
MLANPSNFGPEGLNESPEKKNEMYRTMNLSKPSAMSPSNKGEKPISMWDKMTLYDLQKKKIEDIASTEHTKA